MSQLSDTEIAAAIQSGELTITPFVADMIQPASIDVRLDCHFRYFKKPGALTRLLPINPAKPIDDLMISKRVNEIGEPYRLESQAFALATTYEHVAIPATLAARFEGKSSLGRMGLTTHSTAGFIDPGFTGPITLELFNMSPYPILLWPGMKIGQLCFTRMCLPAAFPYGHGRNQSRYQDQVGPTASRSHINFRSWSHHGTDT